MNFQQAMEIRGLAKKTPFNTRLKLQTRIPGEWESILSGEGIEFAEIRPWQPGDKAKNISYRASEKLGIDMVNRRITEERLIVHVFRDTSCHLKEEGSFFPSKPEIGDIATCFSLWLGFEHYSPVGFYTFRNAFLQKALFPTRNPLYLTGITKEIAKEGDFFQSRIVENDLWLWLRKTSWQSMVFFISDFFNEEMVNKLKEVLSTIVGHCDFIPVIIRDPLEKEIPKGFRTVRMMVRDLDSGQTQEVYLSRNKLKKIQDASREHLETVTRIFRGLGIDYLVLDNPEINECSRAFAVFFKQRQQLR